MRAKELIDRQRELAAERIRGPRRAAKVGFVVVKGIYKTGHRAGRWSERRKRMEVKPPSAAVAALAFAAGAAVGAGGAYLLDPADGKRRRHVLRDRLLATGRRGVREAGRKSRYARGVAEGAAARAAGTDGHSAEDLNDPALARKVESEIFRAPDAPKDRVDVNVADRVVYLRGTLDDPAQAAALVEAARAVDGVARVENLIEAPGSSAETDTMVTEAGEQ